MSTQLQKSAIILVVLIVALVQGCARHPVDAPRQEQRVMAQHENSGSLQQAMAPTFYLTDTDKPHNRIGQVVATGSQAAHTITIAPDRPFFYVGAKQFSTPQGVYTNLIYRIHFLEQPYSVIPFNYGAGQHVGLLVILTLNAHDEVVLVTTAQTCGCYAVSIPTKTLPTSAYPRDWPTTRLAVAGEDLPAQLPAIGEHDLLQIVLRPEVHRVMNIQVVPRASLAADVVHATFADIASLKQLPLEDGTSTSFYYQDWPLTGHVKGAFKPWETLLLGLVSFDLFVGMDKEYGDTHESGNPFHTSLKPWNRHSSDMNDFAGYLRFNGWRL
jgi:hypothetical protein